MVKRGAYPALSQLGGPGAYKTHSRCRAPDSLKSFYLEDVAQFFLLTTLTFVDQRSFLWNKDGSHRRRPSFSLQEQR